MKKIDLLILEDAQMDAQIIIRTLKNSNIHFNATLAANKEEFVAAINIKKFDAVLSDNHLPEFNAIEALNLDGPGIRRYIFHCNFTEKILYVTYATFIFIIFC